PGQFLANLLWSTRGEQQTFLFGPGDQQEVLDLIVRDPNATIAVVTGAWAVPLHLSGQTFDVTRAEAARLQRTEMAFLKMLKTPGVAARVHQWTLADFIHQPMEKMQGVLDEITGPGPRRLTAVPRMREMAGFTDFLGRLRNGGMKPVVMGDFSSMPDRAPAEPARPRIVR
ncbi:MAG: glycosyl transferase, partial [Pseudomonadota bacterium]